MKSDKECERDELSECGFWKILQATHLDFHSLVASKRMMLKNLKNVGVENPL